MSLFANIESREWTRAYNTQHDLLPEHPRTSTTDDMKCFFSIIRDSLGKDFTLQEVHIAYLSFCNHYYYFVGILQMEESYT